MVPQLASRHPRYLWHRLSRPSYTVETALIEQVVSAVDDGYQFDAYIVRWHGLRISCVSNLPVSPSQGWRRALNSSLTITISMAIVSWRSLMLTQIRAPIETPPEESGFGGCGLFHFGDSDSAK